MNKGKNMTKDQLIQLVFSSLPTPKLISELDTTKEADVIRFKWQSIRFRVTTNLFVEEVVGGCLACSEHATLLRALLLAKAGHGLH